MTMLLYKEKNFEALFFFIFVFFSCRPSLLSLCFFFVFLFFSVPLSYVVVVSVFSCILSVFRFFFRTINKR